MFVSLFPKGSYRHIVATNTLSQLVGRVISVLVTSIVSFVIAQRYGPSGYGDFVKITTFSAFFYTLADFGLNALYLQNNPVHAKNSSAGLSAWQNLFGLRLVISVSLVGISLIILAILPHGDDQGYTDLVRMGIILLSPAIVAQAVTTTTNALFQKFLRYDIATVAQNIGSISTVLVIIILLAFPSMSGPLLGVVSILVGSYVTAGVALYFVRKTYHVASPELHPGRMSELFIASIPLGLTLICNLVYFHSDSVVLTLTRSTHEVGIYGLAYKVFELPLVLPIFFMNAVYPLLLKANASDDTDSKHIFWQSFWILLLGSIIIAVGLWILAPLVTFIRPAFAESIAPLRILLLSLPIFFISALFMWVLIAHKKQWVLLGIHTSAMVGNIISNIIWIPQHGYVAAAWITGISEMYILALSAVWVFPILFRKGPQSQRG